MSAPLCCSQYFVGVTLSGDRLAHIRRVAVALADHAAAFASFPWPVENAGSPMQLQLHHPHHPHHSHHHRRRRRRRRQPGNLTKLLCCSQTRSLNGFIITTRFSKEFPKRPFFLAFFQLPLLMDYISRCISIYACFRCAGLMQIAVIIGPLCHRTQASDTARWNRTGNVQ